MSKIILLVFSTIVILGSASYYSLDHYVFTVKIHVPIFGYLDTGLTKSEIYEFIEAQEQYENQKKYVFMKYKNGEIDQKFYSDLINEINIRNFSDPRTTKVTSGPAKSFISFLLDKV